MAIWTTTVTDDYDLHTILYLLKDALSSALADAQHFEEANCPKPDVKGASHSEIAARLGRFRSTCAGLKEREALMLTKILRARQWAEELRAVKPEAMGDIDQFLDATHDCGRYQGEFLPDPQRMFNGGLSLSRFVDERGAIKSAFPGGDRSGYKVAGRATAFELRVACEVFLHQIEELFSPSEPASKQNLLPYFEAAAEPGVADEKAPRFLS